METFQNYHYVITMQIKYKNQQISIDS